MHLANERQETYRPETVLGQLQYVFAMLQFGNQKNVDPTSFFISLSLDTITQQDAQEFAKLLLAHVEGKLNEDLKERLKTVTQGRQSYINWYILILKYFCYVEFSFYFYLFNYSL